MTTAARASADVGLIGLAVMGENLALNMADHGYRVAVYNRTTAVMEKFVAGHQDTPGGLVGTAALPEFVAALKQRFPELGVITGQKAIVTKAKKAIAGFKLRQGMPIVAKVTLRNRRMYEFFDRLVTIALPRIRDFRGVSPKAFDGRGNYTLGLKEQLIFPEIQYDSVASIHGMDITIVTTARTNDEGKALLKHLGMPFRA